MDETLIVNREAQEALRAAYAEATAEVSRLQARVAALTADLFAARQAVLTEGLRVAALTAALDEALKYYPALKIVPAVSAALDAAGGA